MIKLEIDYDSYYNKPVFYFRTRDDCNKFLNVFKDHWCNIRWKDPVEIPYNTKLSSYDEKTLDEDPKKRAESNLSWGFNLARYYGDDKLKPSQQAFIDKMMKEL